MRYASICDGIGAVHVAWSGLGWECAWTSEIEPFPIAVVEHHWKLPNLGDMTRITDDQLKDHGPIDLVCGGTPCQSFSVAGLRKGMADPRGNLALVFLGLVDRIRPRWVVWENVPGVLSSGGGRDFGSFLGAMGQLGYGWSYRVLDAQYFGVPQRRRRVFVVGHLGDWRPAAAVLFERDCLQGNPPPSREAGAGTSRSVAACLNSGGNNGGFRTEPGEHLVIKGAAIGRKPEAGPQYGEVLGDGSVYTLNCTEVHAVSYAVRTAQTGANGIGVAADVTHTLDQAQGQAVAFAQNTRDEIRLIGGDGQTVGALAAQPGMKQQSFVAFGWQNSSSQGISASEHITPSLDKSKTPAVAFMERGREGERSLESQEDLAYTVQVGSGGSHADKRQILTPTMAVRRLTPRECERLQGFPDDFTAVPFKGKPAADGPRYRALGNSMAVPVMRWIGERIQQVESL